MVPIDCLDEESPAFKIEFWVVLFKNENQSFDYGYFFHLVFIREIIFAWDVSSFEMALNGFEYFL